MALATLSIDLEAKLANLEQGMGQAARITEKNAQQMQRSLDSIKTAGAALGGVLAGAFAGFSVVAFVRGTITGIDALNDLKDATGASIENISALEDVAARTGTSFESVGTTLIKFNKVLNDAKPGSEISNTLKSLGLDTEKLKQIDPAEALRQTAVALSGYADEGGKARFVQEAFGKSIKEAAPFLKDLATQGQLVATVTAQQAEEAEKFNQQLDSLSKNSKDAARSLVSNLLPALVSINSELLDGKAAYGSYAAAFLDVLGGSQEVGGLAKTRKQLGELRADLAVAAKEAPTLFDEMFPDKTRAAGIQLEIDLLEKRERFQKLQQARAALDAGSGITDRFDRPLPGLKIVGKTGGDDNKGKKEQIDESTRALAQFVDQLDKQLTKEQDLTETQKALNALQAAGKVGEIPQVRELVLNLAKKKEALDDELEREKELERVKQKSSDLQRQRDNALDAFSGRTLDQQKRELGERLEDRIKAGEIFSPEELDRIVKGIAGISTQVKETSSDIEEFTKSAAASIEGTLGSSIESALHGNFDSIEGLWKNMLINMTAQALQAQLSKALFGDAAKTGSLGGLSGAFVSWLKSADGNAFDGSGPMRFAAGGVFDSPHLFKFANGGAMQTGVLGEAGPEAVMPLRRGSDGRLGVASSGGGRAVTFDYSGQTINVGQGVSRGEMAAAMRQTQAETETRIRRLMRDGNI